jgi:3-ketosteroid 9alpha-monooxygenase subunit B
MLAPMGSTPTDHEPHRATPAESATTVGVPDTLVIRLGRRKHTVGYHVGDTLLETARRGGLNPPFSCEAGNCATCMAHLDVGAVHMRANNALTAEDLAEGWVLTCQSVPTSAEIVVDYDA